jgi:hypothetical protein
MVKLPGSKPPSSLSKAKLPVLLYWISLMRLGCITDTFAFGAGRRFGGGGIVLIPGGVGSVGRVVLF